MNRRDFLTTVAGGAVIAAAAPAALAKTTRKTRPDGFAWAHLMHFGSNFWGDWDGSRFEGPEAQFQDDRRKNAKKPDSGPQNHLRFDYAVWEAATARMAEKGLNMVVIDMGEAVKLPSRPELAVAGSWEVDRFRKELDRLRGLGLEPIPKFNFSACHDAWLKDYGHKMGTKEYYDVTADVIRDTCEIFGTPRYFHIGYEEEFGDKYERPDDLWWHDLYHLVDKIEKAGSRAWAWTDYPAWRPGEVFAKKMPKGVLQSAWWYAKMNDLITCPDPRMFVKAGLFATLEKMGFDQIPCGSNYCCDENMREIVKCGDAVVKGGRLKGYLMTTWKRTQPENRKAILDSVDLLSDEM